LFGQFVAKFAQLVAQLVRVVVDISKTPSLFADERLLFLN